MNSKLAPIVLFVFNRLDHTQQTIDALKKNNLAQMSDLIIFSDAPKLESQIDEVNNVRQFINQTDGFRSIKVFERESNLGLAQSIIDGVTLIVNKYGRVIVLEDDLSVSPYFLEYMNSALDTYQNEYKVMHISGYMFPVEDFDLPETVFLRVTSSWGWATWDRAWEEFETSSKILLDSIKLKKLNYEFDIQGAIGYTKMLENQLNGYVNSWAIRWYASVFLNKGLCLYPAHSLVNNIGHDGTGIHCGTNTTYNVEVSKIKPIVKKQEIKESLEGLKAIKTFYRSFKPSLYIRIYNKLIRMLMKLKIW